jgi:hypothetical protein
VFFMVVTYVVPIVVMTITYARVGVELWGSQSIGECTQRQMENIRSKRRVSQSIWTLKERCASVLRARRSIHS